MGSSSLLVSVYANIFFFKYNYSATTVKCPFVYHTIMRTLSCINKVALLYSALILSEDVNLHGN